MTPHSSHDYHITARRKLHFNAQAQAGEPVSTDFAVRKELYSEHGPENSRMEDTRSHSHDKGEAYWAQHNSVNSMHMGTQNFNQQYNNPTFDPDEPSESDVKLEFVDGHAKYHHGFTEHDDDVFVENNHTHNINSNSFQNGQPLLSPYQYSNVHSNPLHYSVPKNPTEQSQPYHLDHFPHSSQYAEHHQPYYPQYHQSSQEHVAQHPAPYPQSTQLSCQNNEETASQQVIQGNQSPHRHQPGSPTSLAAADADRRKEVKQKVPAKEGFRRAFSVRARRHMRRVVEYISK